MHKSLIERIIEERRVYIEGEDGQERKPSDYVLSEEEIEKGGSDIISSRLNYLGVMIMFMEQYPSGCFYGVHWETGYAVKQALEAIRHIYSDLEKSHRVIRPRSLLRERELEGISMWGENVQVGYHFSDPIPIHTLFDNVGFRSIIHGNMVVDGPLLFRLGFRDGTLGYQYKLFRKGSNLISFLSHYNCIEFLPEFIRRTHKLSLPDIVMGAIKQHLWETTSQYAPLVRTS